MENNYQLINTVDPSKIKVNIKERFSKLTLSSNKKNVRNALPESKPITNASALKRVSRNLLEDLQAKECVGGINSSSLHVNPLFRSSSLSQLCDRENTPPAAVLPRNVQKAPHPLLDDNNFTENFFHMDELRISTTTDNTSHEKDDKKSQTSNRLLQQLSVLSLNSNSGSKKDSQFSEERNLRTNDDAGISKSRCNIEPLISGLSLDTTSSVDDSVICISVSSDSDIYDVITSNIPRTGETQNALLPNTLSNDKADRVENYLREVSVLRKQLQLDEGDVLDASKGLCIGATSPNRDVAKALSSELTSQSILTEKVARDGLRRLLMEDTEIMSDTQLTNMNVSCRDPESFFSQPRIENNHKMKLANDDTVVNTLSSMTAIQSQIISENSNLESSAVIESDNSNLDILDQSALPEESIIIPETSAEYEDEVEATSPQHLSNSKTPTTTSSGCLKATLSRESEMKKMTRDVGNINISATINIKIRITDNASSGSESTHPNTDDEHNDNNDDDCQIVITCNESGKDSLTTGDDYQNKIGIESVGGIHDEGGEGPSKINNDNIDKRVRRNKTSAPPKQKGDHTDDNLLPSPKPTNNYREYQHTPSLASLADGSNIMDYAQKLLTPLYGNTWQTPQVMQTLKMESIMLGERQNAVTSSAQTTLINDTNEYIIHRRNLDIGRNPQKRNPSSIKKRTQNRKVTGRGRTVEKMTPPRATRLRGKGYKMVDHCIDDNINQRSFVVEDDEEVDQTDRSDTDESWQQTSSNSEDNDSSENENEKHKSTKTATNRKKTPFNRTKSAVESQEEDKLVYLDLTKDEIEVCHDVSIPTWREKGANNLENVLQSCKYDGRTKLLATPRDNINVRRRKLFTPHCDMEDENWGNNGPDSDCSNKSKGQHSDNDNVQLKFHKMPEKFEPFNKQLESIKKGNPIFKAPTPKTTGKINPRRELKDLKFSTPSHRNVSNRQHQAGDGNTPKDKYGFLKSLDVITPKIFSHPDALLYREQYRTKRVELTDKLYKLYNEKVFRNELKVDVVWNKKLTNTAGRCVNKKKAGVRLCVIELSEKVLTSADRLRCTLIHEMCHAATWVFNGEGGHGATWKSWAQRSNTILPEIPKIGVCHQYDIEYKYTYKCTLCGVKSNAHSKSKKVENIRCSFCHGKIEIFHNKKDKEGNVIMTPVREPKGFAKFVKDKYKNHTGSDLKHADIMKILSKEFALLKCDAT